MFQICVERSDESCETSRNSSVDVPGRLDRARTIDRRASGPPPPSMLPSDDRPRARTAPPAIDRRASGPPPPSGVLGDVELVQLDLLSLPLPRASRAAPQEGELPLSLRTSTERRAMISLRDSARRSASFDPPRDDSRTEVRGRTTGPPVGELSEPDDD